MNFGINSLLHNLLNDDFFDNNDSSKTRTIHFLLILFHISCTLIIGYLIISYYEFFNFNLTILFTGAYFYFIISMILMKYGETSNNDQISGNMYWVFLGDLAITIHCLVSWLIYKYYLK